MSRAIGSSFVRPIQRRRVKTRSEGGRALQDRSGHSREVVPMRWPWVRLLNISPRMTLTASSTSIAIYCRSRLASRAINSDFVIRAESTSIAYAIRAHWAAGARNTASGYVNRHTRRRVDRCKLLRHSGRAGGGVVSLGADLIAVGAFREASCYFMLFSYSKTGKSTSL